MSFAFLFSLTTFKAINVVFLVGIVSYPSVKKQKNSLDKSNILRYNNEADFGGAEVSLTNMAA